MSIIERISQRISEISKERMSNSDWATSLLLNGAELALADLKKEIEAGEVK